jgi:hypothetical protein
MVDKTVRKPRLRLVSSAKDAKQRVTQLRKAGYQVAYEPTGPALLQKLRSRPPHAVVIDLQRGPSLGRDVGIAVRHYKATRRLPLVFVGGVPEKVRAIRRVLPDAVYTTWSRIDQTLERAIAHPSAPPTATPSLLEGYSGTPLPKKLGIKPNATVWLAGAPAGFRALLGHLPDGAALRTRAGGSPDLIVWFVRSSSDLEARIGKMAAAIGRDGLWIAWPKKMSPLAAPDLTQTEVRRAGLAIGLVDYKICAVDADWSALKFARRRDA